VESIAVKTEINLASFAFIIPELIIAAALIIILLIGLLQKNKYAGLYILLTSLAILSALAFTLHAYLSYTNSISIFVGMLQIDTFSHLFKMACLLSALLSMPLFWYAKAESDKPSEQMFLVLTMLLGALLLVSSSNLIMLIISLELLSFSAYILVGFAFNKKSAEGSLKYFLFGAAATALMIYGASWLYGMSGTLEFTSSHFISNILVQAPFLYFIAGSLLLAGLLFKIAAVPFHLWVPDVYQSATTPVVALLAALPKIAGIGILVKIYYALNLFGQSPVNWQIIFILIASLSIGFGNFAALRQTEAKRLMAWSSIAHAGFMLIGIISNTLAGLEAMLFYTGIYLLSNFLVFGIIQFNERRCADTGISSFSGLGKTHTYLAIALSIGMLALTGIPPTAGFTAKFLIFSQLWVSWSQQSGSTALLFLLIFGLLNTVPALYYYLRIPYYMFFKEPLTDNSLKTPVWLLTFYLLLSITILWFFFRPDMLMSWINRLSFVL
jgi:NADH-quinone oxidoreductase subunit N